MNILQRIEHRARHKGAMAELHPETTTRTHLMSVRSDAQMLTPYSYLDALVAYENHVWVKKAVNVIADNSAPLPLYIERGSDRIENHPLLALLNHPNDEMAPPDLWRWWVTDMLLGGESGFEVVKSGNKKIAELWPRQPHQFAVSPDPQRLRYWGVRWYEIDDKQGEPYKLPSDEFMHWKFFNPRNPWRGVAVLLALRLSIAIDVFAQAHEKYLFQNQARPDFAIVTPQGTTQKERDDIEKKVEQKFGGSGAGGVIALEDQVTDLKILSWRPKDLGDLPLREMSRDEIAGGFGVPDILMGFGSDSYDTQIKRTAAIQALYSLTIKPLLGFRDSHLTLELQNMGVLRPDEFIHTDYSDVGELQEEADAEWKRASEQIASGVMTINEYRKERGQDPLPWGDPWWAPANLVPITGAAALPAPAPEPVPEGQALQLSAADLALLASGQAHNQDLLRIVAFLANALAQQRNATESGTIHLPGAVPAQAQDEDA